MLDPKLFFTKEDFNDLADLKGSMIELHIPIPAEVDYEFGIQPQQSTKKIRIKTILNDQRETVSIQNGRIVSGNFTAQFVDPAIPDPLPKDSWFVHKNIRYKAEEQSGTSIQGKKVVRSVKLTQDPSTTSVYGA